MIQTIKSDFPLLNTQGLIYLDSAATSQKPLCVIKKIEEYYTQTNANIHRGIYKLAEKATQEYEAAREKVRQFFTIPKEYEIIFTKNATEAINLIAYSLLGKKQGKVISTIIEHHANFVPWQQLAKEFDIMDIKDGAFDLAPITPGTILVAATLQSNVTGEYYDPQALIKRAQEVGAYVLLDACQAAAHLHMQTYDAEFIAFSAHKILGPTGLGVLIAKKSALESMPPFLFGGEMIDEVTIQKTTFAKAPLKYEAGTMPIAQAVAFAQALTYIEEIGIQACKDHMQMLTQHFYKELHDVKQYIITDQNHPQNKAPVFSLAHPNVHPYDIAAYMDSKNIAVRAGNHCAMPYIHSKKLVGTLRASAHIYTTKEEIELFAQTYKEAIQRLG